MYRKNKLINMVIKNIIKKYVNKNKLNNKSQCDIMCHNVT